MSNDYIMSNLNNLKRIYIMNNNVKQMNMILTIIVAWLISMIVCFVIGVYWFPSIINYPLNYSIPLTYLLYPLCKNGFNYKIAYKSISFLVNRIIISIMILIILNSLHSLAEQIRMNEIN